MNSNKIQRVPLSDFAGQPFHVSADVSLWESWNQGHDVLLLGVGPAPCRFPLPDDARRIFWADHPETLEQMRTRGATPPPEHWQQLTLAEAKERLFSCHTFFYKPNMRLAPDFWGPIWGQLHLSARQRTCGADQLKLLLPGDQAELLHKELVFAANHLGLHAEVLPATVRQPVKAAARWAQTVHRNDLVLAVNMRGLDAEGRIAYSCLEAGAHIALWFVDNPWHILSAAKNPWWRECHLFVTDKSFLAPLRRAGAKFVHFLPLAVAPHMWRPTGSRHRQALFVGRTSFPQRDQFFAAARVPEDLLAFGKALVQRATPSPIIPDIHWWIRQLSVQPWPGYAIRHAGLGAELCSCTKRVHWVDHAARKHPFRVVGDADWKKFLPDIALEKPVDYYTALPQLYHESAAVLNVTSLLLPHSLSQRHFDVWAAGGLLLSDPTPGLEIFPEDLITAIRLDRPEDFHDRLELLRSAPAACTALCEAWRQELRAKHGYIHRLREILLQCGL